MSVKERARYRIGRISELIGISTEALRYYEREGLVTPEKAKDSGYRSYTAWDVHVLIRSRMYRKYGLTLDETVRVFNSNKYSDVMDLLEEKERHLAKEILEQQRLLKQLHATRYVLADAKLNMGKFRVENSPAMHFMDTQRSYSIIDDSVDEYSFWIEHVPYAVSGGMFDYPVLKDGELRYGLIIEDANMGEVPEEILAETVAIPPQKCLTTFFVSGSDKELCLDMFEPAFEYLHKHDLHVSGTPFARMVHMYHEANGEYVSWYQGWVPFEGDFNIASPVPPSLSRERLDDNDRKFTLR